MDAYILRGIFAKYGWAFMAWIIFYPVYRDFVRGMMMGLLGY